GEPLQVLPGGRPGGLPADAYARGDLRRRGLLEAGPAGLRSARGRHAEPRARGRRPAAGGPGPAGFAERDHGGGAPAGRDGSADGDLVERAHGGGEPDRRDLEGERDPRREARRDGPGAEGPARQPPDRRERGGRVARRGGARRPDLVPRGEAVADDDRRVQP